MDKITKQYALRALDHKIEKITEYITWQTNIRNTSKRELETKQDTKEVIGGFGVTTKFDESTSAKLFKESSEKIETSTTHLANYKKAREDINKL